MKNNKVELTDIMGKRVGFTATIEAVGETRVLLTNVDIPETIDNVLGNRIIAPLHNNVYLEVNKDQEGKRYHFDGTVSWDDTNILDRTLYNINISNIKIYNEV